MIARFLFLILNVQCTEDELGAARPARIHDLCIFTQCQSSFSFSLTSFLILVRKEQTLTLYKTNVIILLAIWWTLWLLTCTFLLKASLGNCCFFSGFSLTEVQKKQAMLNACKSHPAGKPKGMYASEKSSSPAYSFSFIRGFRLTVYHI